jgi:hypothetical protein
MSFRRIWVSVLVESFANSRVLGLRTPPDIYFYCLYSIIEWYLQDFRARIPLYNIKWGVFEPPNHQNTTKTHRYSQVPAGFSILTSTHMICGFYTHGSECGFFLREYSFHRSELPTGALVVCLGAHRGMPVQIWGNIRLNNVLSPLCELFQCTHMSWITWVLLFLHDTSIWIQTRLSSMGLSWRHHVTFSWLKSGHRF